MAMKTYKFDDVQTQYPNSKNTNSYQEGIKFQDFVTLELFRKGIIVQNFQSQKYQYQHGENIQNIEIKLDKRCIETKRLSIEIAEKTKENNLSYVPSGIYSNSIMYVQGNFDLFFVFSTKMLKLLYLSRRYAEKTEKTLKAFYLPIKDAKKYSIMHVGRIL